MGIKTCNREWLSWSRILFFLCFIAMFVEYIDMLIILIDHFVLLSALILILPWLFWSLHMHTLTIVHHLACCVVSLACILSWSSFEHDVHIAIHPDSCRFLCGHEWYIMYSAWPHVAWLPFLCMIAWLLVYVGRIYIPLPPTLLVSVIPFISVLTIASVRPSVCLLSDRARD